jgi:hypothetical protein
MLDAACTGSDTLIVQRSTLAATRRVGSASPQSRSALIGAPTDLVGTRKASEGSAVKLCRSLLETVAARSASTPVVVAT